MDKYIDFKSRQIIIEGSEPLNYDNIGDVFDIVRDRLYPVFNKRIATSLRELGLRIVLTRPNNVDITKDVYYFLDTPKFKQAFDMVKTRYIKEKNSL